MKRLIAFLTCLLSGFPLLAQHNVTFKLVYSESYATYDFLTKISNGYPDNDLKTLFVKSKYNTEAFREKISDFQNLRLNYTYAFTEYPQPLKSAMVTVDLLEKNLITSSTLADFKNRSFGIIPNRVLIEFTDIIEMFMPVYSELVYEPNKEAVEVQKNNLSAYISNKQFEDYFQTGLIFYNTAWDKDIPFELNLLPSLDKGNLGARAFFNAAVCEASLGLKDHKSLFSVAMHEIYHIVYDNQSPETKRNIQKWFNDTNSANSQYALLLLNEVLATALGNAYILEQLNGRIDENDWYGNKYISGMAQAIYPTVKRYIQNKLPIDEAFVKTYVSLYDANFPNWTSELSHIFMYRYIISDDESDWGYFRKTYRYHSNSRFGSPISPSELEKANNLPITKVIVISNNHQQKLDWLKSEFKELKDKKMNGKKEFIEVVTLQDRTKLFIINRNKSTVEMLMKKKFPENILK